MILDRNETRNEGESASGFKSESLQIFSFRRRTILETWLKMWGKMWKIKKEGKKSLELFIVQRIRGIISSNINSENV